LKVVSVLLITLIGVAACAPATMPPAAGQAEADSQPVDSDLSTHTPLLTDTPLPANTPATATPPVVRLDPFGVVSISVAEIEFNLNGDGRNVDSIAFWEAADPTRALMFITSKGNSSIEVYQYPFQEQTTTIACGEASNGVWVDQERDVLYITRRHTSDVCAFNLPSLQENPALSFTTQASGDDSEPNLTLLTMPDGQRRLYVSYDERVFYHNALTGASLGEFSPLTELETMYADDHYQVLYIPDEGDRSGVYVYDPDGNPVGEPFGANDIFDSDAEGIWVYKCLAGRSLDYGEGLIVVADQKDSLTDFEVFDRKTKAYLGKINIEEVNNTDGIAISQVAFPAYPAGLLAVIDDDSRVVGVGWDTLLERTGLSCGE
jgi:hypothetical protein